MFSFSARFISGDPPKGVPLQQREFESIDYMSFHVQALELIEISLKQAGDNPPPLCLLQAMVLSTFCELTNGVRGQGWRLLGSCVRLAYELNLHLIDYDAQEESVKIGQDLSRWTADEERRRCWWAIFTMDSFASTIRRNPTGIDWSMIETYLPVADEFWFNNQYQPSCFLHRDPSYRCKLLKMRGNESADAWMIAINSIMRNAQVSLDGNLQGVRFNVDPHNNTNQLLHYFRNSFLKKKTKEDSMMTKLLIESLQIAIASLPNFLVYRGEYLDFSNPDDTESRRAMSAKYNIFITVQLARFMIYHHYGFDEVMTGAIFADTSQKGHSPSASPANQGPFKNAQGLQTILLVADDICGLTTRCSDDHVKHVNPFNASIIWLSASLQVLRRHFGNYGDPKEIAAKCDLLYATCERFTKFWHTPLALLENLNSLEARISKYQDAAALMESQNEKRLRQRKGSSHSSSTKRDKIQRELHSTQQKMGQWYTSSPETLRPQNDLAPSDSKSVTEGLSPSRHISPDPTKLQPVHGDIEADDDDLLSSSFTFPQNYLPPNNTPNGEFFTTWQAPSEVETQRDDQFGRDISDFLALQ